MIGGVQVRVWARFETKSVELYFAAYPSWKVSGAEEEFVQVLGVSAGGNEGVQRKLPSMQYDFAVECVSNALKYDPHGGTPLYSLPEHGEAATIVAMLSMVKTPNTIAGGIQDITSQGASAEVQDKVEFERSDSSDIFIVEAFLHPLFAGLEGKQLQVCELGGEILQLHCRHTAFHPKLGV